MISTSTTNERFQIHRTAIAIDIATTPFGRSNAFQNEIALLNENDDTADSHNGCVYWSYK